MARDRAGAEARGRRAESIAAWWLRFKGYSIIGRRVRTVVGEIDLIAVHAGTLVFVEVKARETLDKAAAALHPDALRRVARAAAMLEHRFGATKAVRIDAVLVVPRHWPRHLHAVWSGNMQAGER